MQRNHGRALLEERSQVGGGGLGVEGLDAEQHIVAGADAGRVVGGGNPDGEIALDAADPQAVLPQGGQVPAASDQVHLGSGLGQPAAEVAAHAAGP